MLKKSLLIILSIVIVFSLVSCDIADITTNTEEEITTSSTNEEIVTPVLEYETKAVNVFRKKDEIDTILQLRFYNETPHVPYIGVSKFYTEFYKHDLTLEKVNNVFKYIGKDGEYLKFDTQENEISIFNVSAFGHHPDFVSSTSKIFVMDETTTDSLISEKIIALNNYNIKIYDNSNENLSQSDDFEYEVYVPLTLLSTFSSGSSGYSVAYNGLSIYVLDSRGQLTTENATASYFGDDYLSVLTDGKPRYEDLAQYTYNQICLEFDNFRGLTNQLVFGDNCLLGIGLNGLLELYHPKVKEYLLSLDKSEYIMGIMVLFAGLSDGGHTGLDESITALQMEYGKQVVSTPEFNTLYMTYARRTMKKIEVLTNYEAAKSKVFSDYDPTTNPNVYHFDPETKTAYICFDSFTLDFRGWDTYYNNGMKEEDIPENDTFSFVRDCFYQALEDNAENVVLDLTTNGGGNVGIVYGITSLLNKGVAKLTTYNVIDKNAHTDECTIDINLDGVYDEKDAEECEKFTFNVGVLTSSYSFSSANLLPTLLKENGCKIIGEKSGGGSCSVFSSETADGICFVRSSNNCMVNSQGKNVDSGVELDFEITDVSQFYDFVTIASYFSSLKEAE